MKKENLLLIVAVFSVILSSVAFAGHVVKYSNELESLSYNDSIANIYNISVQNTDVGAEANISQVNITLPNGIAWSGTPSSDLGGVSSSSSSVLSWTNSAGLVMNLSKKYFWFNALVATPGNYVINVTTVNASGTNILKLNVTIVDVSGPRINYSSPFNNPTYSNLDYIIFNITAQDNSGVDRLTLRVYNSSALINTASATSLPLILNVSNLSEGSYSYNVSVNDTLNNINNDVTRSAIIDRTGPTVTLGSASVGQTTMTASITISDLSGMNSQCYGVTGGCGGEDVTGTGNSQTLTDSGCTCATTYTYNITCKDRAGNTGSATSSFTTSACSSGGDGDDSGSGGSNDDEGDYSEIFWTGTYTLTDIQFDAGYTKVLETRNRFSVKVNGETHYVGIVKLTATRATVNVSSTPQQAVMSIGETQNFEVSSDNYYDIQLTLNNINITNTADKAELTIKSVHEKIPGTSDTVTGTTGLSNGTTANQTEENESESAFFGLGKTVSGMVSKITGKVTSSLPEFMKNKWFWIGIGIVAVIIGGGVYFVREGDDISRKVKIVDESDRSSKNKEEK